LRNRRRCKQTRKQPLQIKSYIGQLDRLDCGGFVQAKEVARDGEKRRTEEVEGETRKKRREKNLVQQLGGDQAIKP
jgi:hypothetical protein